MMLAHIIGDRKIVLKCHEFGEVKKQLGDKIKKIWSNINDSYYNLISGERHKILVVTSL